MKFNIRCLRLTSGEQPAATPLHLSAMWLDLRQLIAVPAQLLCPPPLPHTCRPQIQVNFDSIIGVPICSEAGDRRLSGLRFSHVISRKLF